MTYRIAGLYSNDEFEPGDSLTAAKELLEESLGNKSNILMLCVFAPVKTQQLFPIREPLSLFQPAGVHINN